MSAAVDRAVIPLAGLATRIQPLARAFPKEMLPLGDRPVIHHVIDELVGAGVRHIVLVLGTRAEAIRRYFGCIPELDAALAARGRGRDTDPIWRPLATADVELSYVLQEEPAGVADAIARARDVIEGRPCVVHMGDSVAWPSSTVISRMIQAFEETDADMTVSVGDALVHAGVASAVAEPLDTGESVDRPFRVGRLLEQRPPGSAALPFVTGRYVFKGPLQPWKGEVSDFGRLGGLAPLIKDPDAARVIGVPFGPHERLLGSGTLAEYHASWHHILEGEQA
ncbi:MAG TPA: sugar phosphate nucleotidyltransferase [Actinocrinis sp.]|jgi:UTP--glucose-1-phosphate uridylyltransferase